MGLQRHQCVIIRSCELATLRFTLSHATPPCAVVHLSENKARNKANMVLPKYQWPMHLVWLDDSSVKRMDTFVVTGPNKVYELKTSSTEERLKWVDAIRKGSFARTPSFLQRCACVNSHRIAAPHSLARTHGAHQQGPRSTVAN